MAPNPVNAVPAIKAAVRGYRASESSARDLILTVFKVLDDNLDLTASTINGLVDLLDEEDKKQDLLGSWRGFNLEVCTLVFIPVIQLELIFFTKSNGAIFLTSCLNRSVMNTQESLQVAS